MSLAKGSRDTSLESHYESTPTPNPTTDRLPVSNSPAKLHLLNLPLEIRFMIWKELFSSIVVDLKTYDICHWCDGYQMLPPFPECQHPDHHDDPWAVFSIRQTCHQIHDETDLIWLTYAIFKFADFWTFQSFTKRAKHLRWRSIRCIDIELRLLNRFSFIGPSIPPVEPRRPLSRLANGEDLLLILEEKNLEVFTVRLEYLSGVLDIVLDFITACIARGTGWHKMRIIYSETAFIFKNGAVSGHTAQWRASLSQEWNRQILERDGLGASVTLYGAADHQDVPPPIEERMYTTDSFGNIVKHTYDGVIMQREEHFMVEIRRGKEALWKSA